MADDWQETADAVNRAVTGAVKSLEDVFEKERTVYGGASLAEGLTSAGGIGKGFRFPSIEDANKIINSFKDRRDSIKGRRKRISDARESLSMPFAQDDSSVSYIKHAIESLNTLDELNDSALKYAESYIEKIERAKQVKQADEESMAESFGRSGKAVEE